MSPEKAPDRTIPPERIHWRIITTARSGKYARIAPYIEARDAMEWLDQHVPDWSMDPAPEPVTINGNPGLRVCITGTVAGQRVTRCDVGVPSRPGSPEAAPIKGAFSDGLKRAAVHFGCARELYSLPEFYAPPKVDGSGRPFTKEHNGKVSITAVAGVPSFDASSGKWQAPRGGYLRYEDAAEVVSDEADVDPEDLAAAEDARTAQAAAEGSQEQQRPQRPAQAAPTRKARLVARVSELMREVEQLQEPASKELNRYSVRQHVRKTYSLETLSELFGRGTEEQIEELGRYVAGKLAEAAEPRPEPPAPPATRPEDMPDDEALAAGAALVQGRRP